MATRATLVAHRLLGSPFFVAPHVALERSTADLYQDDDRVASYQVTSGLTGVDVGSQFYRYGELRLDQLDSVYFPRSGWRSEVNLLDSQDSLGADEEYAYWSADGTGVVSFGDHTFNFYARAADKLGNNPLPRYENFQWGGFLQQSGYSTGQLLGESLQFGRVMYYHRIMSGSLLEGAYGGVSLEAGRIGNPLVAGNSEDWLKSSSVFIGSDSPIGPVYLGYGRAEDGNSSFYFYLGRPF